MEMIIGAAILVLLFGVNAWLYKENKNTPVPEGCENLKPDCEACGIAHCALRDK